jgi:hypothetical protein
MLLQLIKDGNGENTGVFIPIKDWNILTLLHKDLRELVNVSPANTREKLSDLAGGISNTTAEEMQKYVTESRNEWEERLKKQL